MTFSTDLRDAIELGLGYGPGKSSLRLVASDFIYEIMNVIGEYSAGKATTCEITKRGDTEFMARLEHDGTEVWALDSTPQKAHALAYCMLFIEMQRYDKLGDVSKAHKDQVLESLVESGFVKELKAHDDLIESVIAGGTNGRN